MRYHMCMFMSIKISYGRYERKRTIVIQIGFIAFEKVNFVRFSYF